MPDPINHTPSHEAIVRAITILRSYSGGSSAAGATPAVAPSGNRPASVSILSAPERGRREQPKPVGAPAPKK